jgi:hypothetical protein
MFLHKHNFLNYFQNCYNFNKFINVNNIEQGHAELANASIVHSRGPLKGLNHGIDKIFFEFFHIGFEFIYKLKGGQFKSRYSYVIL